MCQISGYGAWGVWPAYTAAEKLSSPSSLTRDDAPRLAAFVLIYRDACLTLRRAYVE